MHHMDYFLCWYLLARAFSWLTRESFGMVCWLAEEKRMWLLLGGA